MPQTPAARAAEQGAEVIKMGTHTITSVATVHRCRAYGGPAHGYGWRLEDDVAPPSTVRLVTDQSVTYRLIHDPLTHQPALDHRGNYLYMPVSSAAVGADDHHPRASESVSA
jgi:hypothetical protein